VEEFLESCRRFAISRRGSEEFIEEFPTFAWECRYKRKWKSTLLQLWKHFVRTKLGRPGGTRAMVYDQMKKDRKFELLSKVHYEEPEVFDYSGLSAKQKAVAVLLEYGFSLKEVRGLVVDADKVLGPLLESLFPTDAIFAEFEHKALTSDPTEFRDFR
jgi:hypothetical protein